MKFRDYARIFTLVLPTLLAVAIASAMVDVQRNYRTAAEWNAAHPRHRQLPAEARVYPMNEAQQATLQEHQVIEQKLAIVNSKVDNIIKLLKERK